MFLCTWMHTRGCGSLYFTPKSSTTWMANELSPQKANVQSTKTIGPRTHERNKPLCTRGLLGYKDISQASLLMSLSTKRKRRGGGVDHPQVFCSLSNHMTPCLDKPMATSVCRHHSPLLRWPIHPQPKTKTPKSPTSYGLGFVASR